MHPKPYTSRYPKVSYTKSKRYSLSPTKQSPKDESAKERKRWIQQTYVREEVKTLREKTNQNENVFLMSRSIAIYHR